MCATAGRLGTEPGIVAHDQPAGLGALVPLLAAIQHDLARRGIVARAILYRELAVGGLRHRLVGRRGEIGFEKAALLRDQIVELRRMSELDSAIAGAPAIRA